MSKSISAIAPGANIVVNSLRIALLIVAVFILASNLLIVGTCQINWIKTASVAASFVDFLYLFVLAKITKTQDMKTYTIYHRLLGYFLLLATSVPCVVVLLCGGDYVLYEILGIYILLDGEKMIFPSACVFFLTITYWMPMATIIKIQNRINRYLKIKYGYVK